jgi:hypothetical protein
VKQLFKSISSSAKEWSRTSHGRTILSWGPVRYTIASKCLEACLFSRSLLPDPFFSPFHVPKDLADKDGLADRLPESVLLWAGWHIGKARYWATYLARDGERETAPALPRQCESREAVASCRSSEQNTLLYRFAARDQGARL